MTQIINPEPKVPEVNFTEFCCFQRNGVQRERRKKKPIKNHDSNRKTVWAILIEAGSPPLVEIETLRQSLK